MLKLKLQYFDHLMGRTDSLKKTLMHGKIEGQQRMRRFDSNSDATDVSLSKLQEIAKDREAWCAASYGVTEMDRTERLNNLLKAPATAG